MRACRANAGGQAIFAAIRTLAARQFSLPPPPPAAPSPEADRGGNSANPGFDSGLREGALYGVSERRVSQNTRHP